MNQQNQPFILKILDGVMKDATMPIQNGTYNIGKGQKNDIILDDGEITENHCTIIIDGGDITLATADGPIYHNNRHILNPTNYVIKQGSYMTIGHTSLGLGNDVVGFPNFKKFTPIMVRSAKNGDVRGNQTSQNNDPLIESPATNNRMEKIKNTLFWLVIAVILLVAGWVGLQNLFNENKRNPQNTTAPAVGESQNSSQSTPSATTATGKTPDDPLARARAQTAKKRADYTAFLAQYPQFKDLRTNNDETSLIISGMVDNDKNLAIINNFCTKAQISCRITNLQILHGELAEFLKTRYPRVVVKAQLLAGGAMQFTISGFVPDDRYAGQIKNDILNRFTDINDAALNFANITTENDIAKVINNIMGGQGALEFVQWGVDGNALILNGVVLGNNQAVWQNALDKIKPAVGGLVDIKNNVEITPVFGYKFVSSYQKNGQVFAKFADKDNKFTTIMLGENLPNGIKLVRLERSQIVIAYKDKNFTIPF